MQRNSSSPSSGLRFGFSTLGCPDLDPAGVRALAAAFGSRFIEVRSLGGSLDLVAELARFPGGAAAVRDFFLESDVRVRLVGSSFQLTRSLPAQRGGLVAEAEIGEALGAKWLRVFGGGAWGDPFTAEAAAIVRAHRTWWQELRAARGWTIDLALEVHDAFSGSAQVVTLWEQTGGPMPLVWDTHHTWKVAGEEPAQSWAHLGPHVGHVHMKDSVSTPADKLSYTYVGQGRGEFPTQATLMLLAVAGFAGVVSFEWEKQWLPALAPLQSVLADWNQATAAFRQSPARTFLGEPQLLLKADFDRARIVPSVGPYFHGGREQYEDIEGGGPTSCSPGLGEPTPHHPKLGKFRIYYEGGDASQRSARIVADDADPGNRVVRFSLTEPNVVIQWPHGPQRKSRVQAEIYGNIELRDFYQTIRLRLRPDAAKLRNYPGKIEWFTLMEFWNNAGWTDEPFAFRFGLHLIKPDPAPGTDLFFATGSQIQEETFIDVWQHVDTTLPVPFGTWLTVETHFRDGDAASGRFYVAVTPAGGVRKVLFDVQDCTHHPRNPAATGLKQFCPLKLYTSDLVVDYLKAQGATLEVDWDDFELWQGRTPPEFPAL